MASSIYLPLQILIILLDILVSIATLQWLKPLQRVLFSFNKLKLRTVPLDPQVPSHRVRAGFVKARASTPPDGSQTLYELAQRSFMKFQDQVCMRRRKFLRWTSNDGKQQRIKEFDTSSSSIEEWTYPQVGTLVHRFGAALRTRGCVASKPTNDPLTPVTTPCRIAIFENTCPEWMMSCLGAHSQSMAVVTVYATLGVEAVQHSIQQNQVRVLVCNRSNVKDLYERRSQMPTLTTLVYTDDLVPVDEGDQAPLPKVNNSDDFAIYSFQDFCQLGDTVKYPPEPPRPETTAVVMYTSGSTGKPKGVIIQHANILAAAASADYVLDLKPSDAYLAYLPLAHIMELLIECVVLSRGCSLNYADPKSLTTKGATPEGALTVYRPTHMVAVPKIWDTIQKGILQKVSHAGGAVQALVQASLWYKSRVVKHFGIDTPLLNKVVFGKFRAAVGGNLKFALSGGGALNGQVQDFIRNALCVPLIQGYGLTETCAALAIQAQDDIRPGVVGVILASCEVKLISTPDFKDAKGKSYLSTDRHDVDGKPIWGRGEVAIRGGNVTKGYYDMPDKTQEVFDEDGWFYTGDIGQFLEDGSLSVMDRKKNLVKLKSGEYVALEKMEMVYGNCEFVDAVAGGVCCFGDGEMDRPVALLQLNMTAATKWAGWANSNKKMSEEDWNKLKKSEDLYKAVMDSLKKEHSNSDLSPIEKLQAVALLDEPWTPENGCLTAANKLQRRVVQETFSKEYQAVKEKGIFK